LRFSAPVLKGEANTLSICIHSLVGTNENLEASFEQYSSINVLKLQKLIIEGAKISIKIS